MAFIRLKRLQIIVCVSRINNCLWAFICVCVGYNNYLCVGGKIIVYVYR